MITSHGSWNTPTSWLALDSKRGRYATHAARPTANPATAPTMPVATPLARTTSPT